MTRKSMEDVAKDVLFIRCHPQDKKKKSSGVRSKSIGSSKSLRQFIRKWWKCGKVRNYKKYWKSKNVNKPKGSVDSCSTKMKTSIEEGGDVYLEFTCTHVNRDVWLI